MQVARVAVSSRRLILAAAAALAVLIVLTNWAAVSAQDPPMYRFFGFAGDLTVDGEPLQPGEVVIARVDGVEVGRAEVNAAGAWVLDVNSDQFDEASCNIVFEVNGLQGRQSGDDCSLRVRLELSSDAPADAAEVDDDQSADDDELSQAGPVVRPEPPRTGTGGIAEAQSESNWPRTAAITACLTLAAALVALMLSRRTDGSA